MRALLLLFVLCACSPALSSMHPASVLGRGQIHVATALGTPIPAGAAADIITNIQGLSAAPSAPSRVREDFSLQSGVKNLQLRPTQDQRPYLANGDRDNLEAGIAAALYPPIPLTETSLRVGLGYRSEIGVRYTVEALEFGARVQLLGDNKPNGFDISFEGNMGVHFFNETAYPKSGDFAILDIQRLFVDDINRTDLSAALLFGGQPNNAFHYWFGPKFMHSDYFIDSPFIEQQSQKGDMGFLGGTLGAALGYKHLWFMFEMTAMNLKLEAEVLGAPADLGGLIVYPAMGLMSRF